MQALSHHGSCPLHMGKTDVRQRDVNPADGSADKSVCPESGKRPMLALQPICVDHPLTLRIGVKVAPLCWRGRYRKKQNEHHSGAKHRNQLARVHPIPEKSALQRRFGTMERSFEACQTEI
ncbi:hypothetical protein PQH03_28285 [Ralstonia insidiosa]|uniref:hypothetical protein n=1 Tax=Ralstonia TaxID=48736 RepID=UPI0012E806E1|nr:MULTISPECIES: hypothetical protein [Ralstonia]MBX3770065.1 hypothetical protein [Ralstonia pickettii]MBX3772877.1 hypothetical protein [Ralstonia pickettii]MBX3780680.1 hypothetical protein [Ralstonia pickettii]MBX3809015.1 hypothetical protein [Ralstonia pickettii]MBX3811668.1 hypothetical protein [Ralstonia pickettii]